VVGDLSLTYEMMDLSADSGLVLLAYTAEPRSKSAEALALLASWTATIEAADATKTPARTP
jgi:transcription regulator MmyB-like protein